MPLANMKEMLLQAKENQYAIGAFNILDYNSMKAVVDAAEELNSPVIIQTSVKTVKFWGFSAIIQWTRELLEKSTMSIALHLDHCKDVNFIKQCIDYGWSSVMIDASTLPFVENKEITKQVVELARKKNVSVEAELGAIVGVEDDIHVKEQNAHLANPDQAEEFCRELGLDCFAPAVGTAHGMYKGEPRIAFDLIKEIAQRTGVPLALHGGTGLSEGVFRKAISLGCAKVNISTELKHIFIDSFMKYCQENVDEYNPLKPLAVQYDLLKKGIKNKMIVFGSEGKGTRRS